MPDPHPLAGLFPKLTAAEIETIVVAARGGVVLPDVRRLSPNQKAMFVARVAIPLPGNSKDTSQQTASVKAVSQLLGVKAGAIANARWIVTGGTPEEIAQADAGKLPMTVGREICEGVPVEVRRRPDGLRRPSNTRRSPVVERVLARIAEDEAKKAAKRERDNETRRRRLLSSSASNALTLPDMIEALVAASGDVTAAEAAALLRGRVDRAKLTMLVEWLIELDGKVHDEAAE